jgi:hypothetical protein
MHVEEISRYGRFNLALFRFAIAQKEGMNNGAIIIVDDDISF